MIFPLNIYHFLSNPTAYLQDLHKKYGDPFPLAFPGSPTVWLTAEPEMTKSIFTAPLDSFHTSENNPVGPLLGPEGLIMLSANAHLEQRKEFTPHFAKKNLAPFAPSIQEVFFSMFDQGPESGTITLQHFAQQSTLLVILKLLFPHLNQSELDEAKVMTEQFLNSYSASFLFIPKWVPGTWSSFENKKIHLDEKFYRFFLKGLESDCSGPLAKLKDAPKAAVLDHIRTFIVAGHETSATSLVWALYYIHKIPYIKNRLFEELSVFGQKSKSEYLEAILCNQYLDALVSESLRIQPPVPFITRKITNRDFKLGERTFMPGEEIGVCLTLLHRHVAAFEAPAEFRPERFINKKFSPFEFAPFGGGARKCIGAELAILEIKILIGHFIKHYDATLIASSPPLAEVQQITAGPKKAIQVHFKKIN